MKSIEIETAQMSADSNNELIKLMNHKIEMTRKINEKIE